MLLRWGWLIIALIIGLAFLINENRPPTTQNSTSTATNATEIVASGKKIPLVRLAWFTNIPREQDMFRVIEWFDLYIFHQGNEKDRELMVALGARGPILQYILFESIQDPDSCTAKPKVNQVAYLPGDYCMISEQHADWFLLDTTPVGVHSSSTGLKRSKLNQTGMAYFWTMCPSHSPSVSKADNSQLHTLMTPAISLRFKDS